VECPRRKKKGSALRESGVSPCLALLGHHLYVMVGLAVVDFEMTIYLAVVAVVVVVVVVVVAVVAEEYFYSVVEWRATSAAAHEFGFAAQCFLLTVLRYYVTDSDSWTFAVLVVRLVNSAIAFERDLSSRFL
jgi:hypothetical protein